MRRAAACRRCPNRHRLEAAASTPRPISAAVLSARWSSSFCCRSCPTGCPVPGFHRRGWSSRSRCFRHPRRSLLPDPESMQPYTGVHISMRAWWTPPAGAGYNQQQYIQVFQEIYMRKALNMIALGLAATVFTIGATSIAASGSAQRRCCTAKTSCSCKGDVSACSCGNCGSCGICAPACCR